MKQALRAVQWIIAVAVALPLVPLAMSLCAGIYLVAVAADKGERRIEPSIVGGLISILISAVGIFITYELVRLGLRLAGG